MSFEARREMEHERIATRQGPTRYKTALIAAVLLALMIVLLGSMDSVAAPAVELSWDPPDHVSTNAANGAFRPVLRQAPGGTLVVAYNHEKANGTRNPYYSRSTDDGVTWSTPAPIRSASQHLRQVTLALDNNGAAHAVWRSGSGLAHAREDQWPNGENTIVSTADVLFDPYLVIGDDNVLHVVWAQAHGTQALHDIFHAYSTNGGSTWSTPTNLIVDNDRHSSAPAVAVDAQNNLHVVWEERILDLSLPNITRYEVHYLKGTKAGSSYNWPANATVLSGNIPTARRPAIVADDNDLHVSFARQTTNEEQYPYYRRFIAGSGWTAARDASSGNPVSVNTNSPFFLISSVANCNNGVYLYYHGSDRTNANEQIFGVSDYDSWGAVDTVTSDSVRHINPVVICRGGSLYMVVERVELATLNHQVYFTASRNINGVFLPIINRP